MKKIIAALLMLSALAWMLSGCGMILVEDAEQVHVGCAELDGSLTERC